MIINEHLLITRVHDIERKKKGQEIFQVFTYYGRNNSSKILNMIILLSVSFGGIFTYSKIFML